MAQNAMLVFMSFFFFFLWHFLSWKGKLIPLITLSPKEILVCYIIHFIWLLRILWSGAFIPGKLCFYLLSSVHWLCLFHVVYSPSELPLIFPLNKLDTTLGFCEYHHYCWWCIWWGFNTWKCPGHFHPQTVLMQNVCLWSLP